MKKMKSLTNKFMEVEINKMEDQLEEFYKNWDLKEAQSLKVIKEKKKVRLITKSVRTNLETMKTSPEGKFK